MIRFLGKVYEGGLVPGMVHEGGPVPEWFLTEFWHLERFMKEV